MKSLEERFWAKVELIPFHSCWEWVASKNEHGYGKMTLGRKYEGTDRAHRVSYRMFVGPTPKGLVVMHKCDNRGCVNPEHLKIGTYKDNSQDMMHKGRNRGQFKGIDPRSDLGRSNTLKTHCPKGHPYSGYNLSVSKEGKRTCKLCCNARARKRNANKQSRR